MPDLKNVQISVTGDPDLADRVAAYLNLALRRLGGVPSLTQPAVARSLMKLAMDEYTLNKQIADEFGGEEPKAVIEIVRG